MAEYKPSLLDWLYRGEKTNEMGSALRTSFWGNSLKAAGRKNGELCGRPANFQPCGKKCSPLLLAPRKLKKRCS